MKKYELLFDVNIGAFHGKPYDIKLKPDAEPYHGKPFPVPRIHELTFKQELDRIKAIKVIKKVNRSQWGAPTFLLPKKDSKARFIYDFRELNVTAVSSLIEDIVVESTLRQGMAASSQ